MRFTWLALLCVMFLGYGCARNHSSTPKSSGLFPAPVSTKAAPNSGLIVTPGQQMTGRLYSVNSQARYVIVTFPLGTMPQIAQRFSVYRKGLKVGEIKISGPQRDVNIAADIVAGECQVGDEVKAE